MAFVTPPKTVKKAPVYYLIVDFRNQKLYSHYNKGIDGDDSFPKNTSRSKKVVIIRTKFLPRSCRPRIKNSEGAFAWRRKSSSRSRHRQSTSPTTRPTLLLPPMRCTTTPANASEANTAPVITTRVQRNDRLPNDCYLNLDNSSHLPQPSAPSPGHVFYNSEDRSDITFIVGQEKPNGETKWRFPAHSFILAKTQPTLSALLETALGSQSEEVRSRLNNMEVNSGESVTPIVLQLPNLQPEVFEQMLRYIYTDQVNFLTVESSLRLLHPSQTYHLPQLTSHCLSHISKNVTTSNVLLVLSHLRDDNHQHDNDNNHDNDNKRNELLDKCFLIVDHHADEVLQSELFETLEHQLMVEIVERDTLEVSTEAVVFDSVMRWACCACKKQRIELTSENKCNVLGNALFLVRYITMTPDEFMRGPCHVLGREDKEVFLSRIYSPNSPVPLPDRWNGWKVAEKRKKCHNGSPHPELSDGDSVVSPSNSIQPVNSNAKRSDCKKKSMSKKLLNGVGDLVICVIQLLD